MCGIIGFIGKDSTRSVNTVDVILDALKTMEYRGYDSAGVVFFSNVTMDKETGLYENEDRLSLLRGFKVGDEGYTVGFAKAKGKISQLRSLINEAIPDDKFRLGNLAVGHTRWATHGEPSALNAHPHVDCAAKIFAVHNGIINNYEELKPRLEKLGHRFESETDTEVIAHLVEYYYSLGEQSSAGLKSAFCKTIKEFDGTWGIIVVHADYPDLLLTAKKGSPVILGLADKGLFVASDKAALVAHTKTIIDLEDGQIAFLERNNHYEILSLDDSAVENEIRTIEMELTEITKQGYESFMLKEICQQAETIKNVFAGRFLPDESDVKLGGLEDRDVHLALVRAKRIVLVGCGTAFYAALLGKYFIEEYANIPVVAEKATELGYRDPICDSESVYIFISQSGETADTIKALKKVAGKNILVLGVVNVVGSAIAKLTKAGVYTIAGPEIAVASTKAFTAQTLALLMIAIKLGRQRGMKEKQAQELIQEIKKLPEKITKIIEKKEDIQKIVKSYLQRRKEILLNRLPDYLTDEQKEEILVALKVERSCVFLGRKFGYPIALEGALKSKEIAYIATEGFPTGELKHGPIALVDNEHLSVFVAPHDINYKHNLSNLEEVKARRGLVFAIVSEGDEFVHTKAEYCFEIPQAHEAVMAILANIPLQLFAYYMARESGLTPEQIDKPRNLAKSVTVE